MAKILSDREIEGLLGAIIVDGDEKLLNPNGIELRLGSNVRFLSTGEDGELKGGDFLKVSPGETVLISSLEKLDFSREAVHKHLPHSMLMAFITPTTTMMREGIAQVATKVDAGFRGNLNWSLRNGSTKDLIIQFGEPIFKLTIFRLEGDEKPQVAYGESEAHKYQDTEGIVRSARRIPADIPKSRLISSGFEKLDPKKQLREAGYPFDHIGTELIRLDGKFEMVSRDVATLKENFENRTKQLTEKIESETNSLVRKIDDTKNSLVQLFELMFSKKFLWVVGVIVGAIPIMYGSVVFLHKSTMNDLAIGFIACLLGIAVLVITWAITRSHRKP